ncbi:MAG: hypothetical protein GX621_10810 [Pirellulaceae bacterium]|nr:hypothetical protein [Pirellulaceae bacterium]
MDERLPIAVLPLVVIGPFLMLAIVPWVVRPLDRAAKARQRPTQFTIVDFLCLFVLAQFFTALIHSIRPGREEEVQEWVPYLLDVYAWISIGLIWWKCAEIMSRAGIDKPWHRVVLLLFVLPVTAVGPLSPFILVIVAAIGMARFSSHVALGLTMTLMVAGVTAGLFVSRRLIRRIVAESESATDAAAIIITAEEARGGEREELE